MAATSTLKLNVFDGSRQPFAKPLDLLITIVDGNQRQQYRNVRKGNAFLFPELPFFDNFGDNYAVTIYADGYRQVGFAPVRLSSKHSTTLDLMLLPNDPGYSFVDARWPAASTAFPFLSGDTDNAAAEARYERLYETDDVLACLLNLGEAMSQIQLQRGTPLDYIKRVRWDKPPQQDRFFAYCDAALVDQVRQAAAAGQFAAEAASAIFHPGATASWKQIRFGEANVQLTFHQNPEDCTTIDDVACVTVEPDMDYYKDPAAHAIFEVIPNGLSKSLTNPIEVYALRWIAGRRAGVPEFSPMYTLV